ncbi:MAG TPA: rhomboid family intramembrane serine protease [Verrucomicrobiae bacterium]
MAKSTWKDFRSAFQFSIFFVAVLFVTFGIDILLRVKGSGLAGFGIIPRTTWGLIGIPFSPLLHANLAHLLANSVPLLVLLTLLFWDRKYHPGTTLTIIWLVSGVGTWLIGRNESGGQPIVHIGASSVIYGIFAYLIASAFWMRRWRSAFIAVLVLFLYGGIVLGAMPQAGPISWEGHLAGMIAGIWCALRLHS